MNDSPPPSSRLRLTVLGSGSAGNSCLIEGGGRRVLLDAGLSARRLTQRLEACACPVEKLDAIVLTHEHGDHTQALKVWSRLQLPVYANALTLEALRFHQKCHPAIAKIFRTGETFSIGELNFFSFSVPHDAADPVGFCVQLDGIRFAYLTDLGKVTQSVVQYVRGVSGFFIEANYDEALLDRDTKRPWSVKQRIASPHGHLSNSAAAELVAQAADASLQLVVLGHLSRDCNSATCAETTLRQKLEAIGHHHVAIHCAEQDSISPPFHFH